MTVIIDASVSEKDMVAYAKQLFRSGLGGMAIAGRLREELALSSREALRLARTAHPLYPYAEYAYEVYSGSPTQGTIDDLVAEIASEIGDQEEARSLVNLVRIMYPVRYSPL